MHRKIDSSNPNFCRVLLLKIGQKQHEYTLWFPHRARERKRGGSKKGRKRWRSKNKTFSHEGTIEHRLAISLTNCFCCTVSSNNTHIPKNYTDGMCLPVYRNSSYYVMQPPAPHIVFIFFPTVSAVSHKPLFSNSHFLHFLYFLLHPNERVCTNTNKIQKMKNADLQWKTNLFSSTNNVSQNW